MIKLASIFWDPKPELFIVPILHWPILWYGILFALGFLVGFTLFVGLLTRYFLNDPFYLSADIQKMDPFKQKDKREVAEALNEQISRGDSLGRNPSYEKFVESSCALHPKRALARLNLDEKLGAAVLSLRRKAVLITDRLTVYMIVATVLGARLGHFIFYERPSTYLKDPWEILRVWEGGLASHGAVIAIVLAMILFSYRIRNQTRGLSWIRLLDFLSIPTALAGSFIRLGNFFNQEILGSPSDLPWAVVFGHPADHSASIPRHPVQIYEALFYLAVFFFLWRLSYRPAFLLARGKLIGMFLILVFGFRFFIEFFKIEQSHIVANGSFLTMGQYLSLPLILAGFLFYFWKRKS
ncbi:MAG: prolipoprotein diacylglyceryl transferase [Chlamydiota bacterium]